jgi:hypothetical protein
VKSPDGEALSKGSFFPPPELLNLLSLIHEQAVPQSGKRKGKFSSTLFQMVSMVRLSSRLAQKEHSFKVKDLRERNPLLIFKKYPQLEEGLLAAYSSSLPRATLSRDQLITYIRRKRRKANSTSSIEAIAAPSAHRLAALIRPRPVRDS